MAICHKQRCALFARAPRCLYRLFVLQLLPSCSVRRRARLGSPPRRNPELAAHSLARKVPPAGHLWIGVRPRREGEARGPRETCAGPDWWHLTERQMAYEREVDLDREGELALRRRLNDWSGYVPSSGEASGSDTPQVGPSPMAYYRVDGRGRRVAAPRAAAGRLARGSARVRSRGPLLAVGRAVRHERHERRDASFFRERAAKRRRALGRGLERLRFASPA